MPDERPSARNVLVICSDEHAGRYLGVAGHPIVRTPNLDALAARGTRFDRAWTPSPICVPARASLATGDWVHQIGAWDSAQPYDGTTRGWAHAARDAGAHAAAIGKLHFRSIDDDYGLTESRRPMHVANGVGWVQGLPRRDPLPYPEALELAAQVGTGESDYTRYDQAITDDTVDWLEQHGGGDRPWALFVSLVAPHYPLVVAEQFVAPYLDIDATPEIGPMPITNGAVAAIADFFAYHRGFADADAVAEGRRLYFGLISWLDHNVGRVLDALDSCGARDDTLIISTSDHGEMAGNRGLWAKSYLYEDSVRVPMIAAGPGVPAGCVNTTAVNLIDVAATVAETMAGEPVANGAARSLVTTANEPDAGRVGFSEYHDGGSITGSFAIRIDNWKYMHHVGFPCELYDLGTDPDELEDLSGSAGHRGTVADCEAVLRSIVDPDAGNEAAFASQEALLAHHGGRAAVDSAFRFNHTPTPN